MDDRISAPDISQELITKSFPFAGTLYEAGDVHDLNGRRNHPVWFDQLFQFDQALVRNRNYADIWLDGAKREIRRLRLGAAQGVEEGRFAYVGESDNACL
jgi:hypothetical protein